MSAPWWGKERARETASTIVGGPLGRCPRLTDETAGHVKNETHGRRPTFTPLWAGPPDPHNVDAGDALVQLSSELATPVLRRLNRLPDKSLIEYLRLAGIAPSPALPAEALVRFTVSPAARRSILVPKGFQVGARAADGTGDLVVFETQASLHATSAQIKEVYVQEGSVLRDVMTENDDPETTYRPLGAKPRVGDALLVGLEAEEAPAPDLSLGIGIAAAPGTPPPVACGGTAPVLVTPMLEWAALTASGFVPVEVLGDETRNLQRSGVVELRLPRRWPARRPAGLDGDQLLYWLRLRVIQGEFDEPPQCSFIQLNMTRVKAVRTHRNEVLEPVDNGNEVSRRMRVRHKPVVPGSLTIEVDVTAVGEELDPQHRDAQVTTATRWKEVNELLSQPPDARVFTLDPTEGVVKFGDGTEHGAAIPPGYRNVRAVSYEEGGGAAGAVDADEINTLLHSASFVTEVTNPLPASGGTDPQDQPNAVRYGPGFISARGRVVTVADYALLARQASGARVARACALSGFHPAFPGLPTPGVVGVLIVPLPEAASTGPPTPTEQDLRAVAHYLAKKVAPAGVEVVAGAPRYRRVRARVGFVSDPAADLGRIVRGISDALNGYLDPLNGGGNGEGWPFGGTLVFTSLIGWLLKVADVRAIPRLQLIVNGVTQPACADVPLGRDELFWPEGHEVFPVDEETTA